MSDEYKTDIFGYKWRKYSYFDEPDGEEILKKWLIFMKPAVVTTIMVSATDILTSKKSLTYTQVFRRIGHLATPIIGGATAFVLVTNLAAKVRGGGDKTSWFLGGASAGLLFGTWWGTGVAAISSTAALGLACLIRKDLLERGWDLLPGIPVRAYGGYFAYRHDWTLTKHIPGNYVTTPPEE
nr:uncharacterized protein LOC111415886 [Onthophagus taurus]